MKNKKIKLGLLVPLSAIAIGGCTYAVVNSIIKNNNSKSPENETIYVTFDTDDSDVIWEGSRKIRAYKGDYFGSIQAPIAYKDGRAQTCWVRKVGSQDIKVSDTFTITESITVYPSFENDIDLDICMGITAQEDSMVYLKNFGGNTVDLKCSSDGYDWKSVGVEDTITIPSGSTCYFKGTNPLGFSQSDTKYSTITISGCANINGNIMTLIDGGLGTETTIPNDYCFYSLFRDSSGIVSLSSSLLSAKHLKPYCYAYMFASCSQLSEFPSILLPANNLSGGVGCYSYMFYNCLGIETIPAGLLPVAQGVNADDKLEDKCYEFMFKGCQNLKSLPADLLPSKDLSGADACYYGMFQDCNNLSDLDENLLPATKLSTNCYKQMFSDCDSLDDLSSLILSTTELTESCYQEMFWNCTSLTRAPKLPATTLATKCYAGMFYNCSSLSELPILQPSINTVTLAPYCYTQMFFQCIGLSSDSFTPGQNYLPNTILDEGCYQQMFAYAFIPHNTSLTQNIDISQNITLNATSLPSNCYYSMFYGANISNTAGFTTSVISAKNGSCQYMYQHSKILKSVGFTGTQTENYDYGFTSMFSNCESLATPGSIIINSAGDSSCSHMFDACTSLKVDDEKTDETKKIFICYAVTDETHSLGWMWQDIGDHSRLPGITGVVNTQYYYY